MPCDFRAVPQEYDGNFLGIGELMAFLQERDEFFLGEQLACFEELDHGLQSGGGVRDHGLRDCWSRVAARSGSREHTDSRCGKKRADHFVQAHAIVIGYLAKRDANAEKGVAYPHLTPGLPPAGRSVPDPDPPSLRPGRWPSSAHNSHSG